MDTPRISRKTSGWLIMGVSMSVLMMSVGMSGCQTPDKSSVAEPMHAMSSQGSRQTMSAAEKEKAALVNVELGLGYLAEGQVSRAKAKLTHALALSPHSPFAASAMAYFLEKVGEWEEAEKAHKKAIRYSKEIGAVYNNYGAFLCRQQRFKEADHAFNKALSDKQYPRTAEVYENAGVCALEDKSSEPAEASKRAEHYFMAATRHDPKCTQALLGLAELSLKQSKWEAAERWLSHYNDIAEPCARSLWLGTQVSEQLHPQHFQEEHPKS